MDFVRTITPTIEPTDDGSVTLRHPLLGDTYHSLRGAVGEAEHVYIAHGLAALPLRAVRILEVGFGSGLNAWLSLRYGEEHALTIDYHAVERYPVDPDVAGQLGYTDDPRFVALHRAPWNEPVPITARFRLTKYDADLTAPDGAWEAGDYDLVYFDAFAPDTQPELWSEALFRRIHARLAAGGVLVTYSAKGCVKQALRAAGFEVHRLPGALGKHHMVRAVKPHSLPK